MKTGANINMLLGIPISTARECDGHHCINMCDESIWWVIISIIKRKASRVLPEKIKQIKTETKNDKNH